MSDKEPQAKPEENGDDPVIPKKAEELKGADLSVLPPEVLDKLEPDEKQQVEDLIQKMPDKARGVIAKSFTFSAAMTGPIPHPLGVCPSNHWTHNHGALSWFDWL